MTSSSAANAARPARPRRPRPPIPRSRVRGHRRRRSRLRPPLGSTPAARQSVCRSRKQRAGARTRLSVPCVAAAHLPPKEARARATRCATRTNAHTVAAGGSCHHSSCPTPSARTSPAPSPSAPRTACGFARAPSSLAGPAARAAAVWTQSRFGQPRSAAPSKTAPPYMGAVCKLDPAGFGSSQRTEAASHFSFPKSRASVLFSLGSCSPREERHDLARAVSCSGSRPVRAGVGAAAPAAR